MRTVLLILFLLFTGLTTVLKGQPYEHSAGVRAGYSSGITYKGFFRYQTNAIEAEILYNRHGFNLTGLYEFHFEPFRNDRWLIYAGGGAFGGNWEGDPSLGVALAGGIELVVRDLPINFSLDWKPMLNLYRQFDYDLLDFGISIRYRFKL
jgi:hypothetical protein